MDGLFMEFGPYRIGTDLKPKFFPERWLPDVDIVFVDQPLGTGFSYVEHPNGLSRNMTQVRPFESKRETI